MRGYELRMGHNFQGSSLDEGPSFIVPDVKDRKEESDLLKLRRES